jgi:hypothetical protein
VFVLNRHVERVFDPSGNENLGAAEAGARSMREDGNDVRFDANSGLAPDSAPCPKSAINGNASFRGTRDATVNGAFRLFYSS